MALLLAGGCGNFNPCDSALYNGLDPAEKLACDQCGNYQGCNDDGETGGESGDTLTCEVQVGSATIDGWDVAPWKRVMCLVGEHPTEIQTNGQIQWPDLEHRDAATCGALSKPFPCRRSWENGPDDDGDLCVMCEPQVDAPGPAADRPPMSENHGWRLCGYGSEPDWEGGLWRISYYLDDSIGDVGWQNWMTCVDAPQVEHFACPKEHVGIKTFLNTLEPISQVDVHTCICESDADCQPGAVCEAGWIIDGGIPRPTLCTWDDGTANGAAPSGPEAYGLSQWSDGITTIGDAITLTSEMFLEATAGDAGLWDDGQRFDVLDFGATDGVADVELTACDSDALCGHIGLNVGDVLSGPNDSMDRLADGDTVELTIHRPDGSSIRRTVTVEI